MMTSRFLHIRSIVVIALGYLVGIASYPFIPGVALDEMRGGPRAGRVLAADHNPGDLPALPEPLAA
jgi:hypothetical protein